MTTDTVTFKTTTGQAKVSRVQVFREYLFAFFLSVASLVVVIKLWDPHWLYVPFNYLTDALYYEMTIKSVITTGWYLTDPTIGVPDGYFLGDFPTPEGLNYLLIKIIALFSSNWALVFNIFFLLGFPLITFSALFVLRRLGLCYPFALTASLLYAFLPFHLQREEVHAFLAVYYTVPLAIWLALILYQNNLFEDENKKKLRLCAYLFVCILIGSTGVYYAYFGAFFILLGGSIAAWTKKQWRPLKYALLFVAAISASIIANISPTIRYQLKEGKNKEAISRSWVESEIYGLKIAQLLLPVDGDRIFSKVKHRYNAHAPLVNENTTATLGLIGSLGFLILIGRIFFRKKEISSDVLLDGLSHLNLSAILLATIGGFSSLIALALFPQIRCYNRISVFIGFFALATFFVFLQKAVKNKKLLWSWSLFLLTLGLFNQSSRSNALPSKIKIMAEEYKKDRSFVLQIEEVLPPGSRIFQLPYLCFPEGTAHQMSSYDHFKGPLHSHTLQWSFGAMKGRKTDHWQKETSNLEISAMLKELIQKGFTGLYIDRKGYIDQGQAIEASLIQTLKIDPICDSHRSFWDLRGYH